jgi:hypothetical protein
MHIPFWRLPHLVIIKDHCRSVIVAASLPRRRGGGHRLVRRSTRRDMPFLVLPGEKAFGTFLIEQMRLIANNV